MFRVYGVVKRKFFLRKLFNTITPLYYESDDISLSYLLLPFHYTTCIHLLQDSPKSFSADTGSFFFSFI